MAIQRNRVKEPKWGYTDFEVSVPDPVGEKSKSRKSWSYYLRFLVLGTIMGIVLTKSEIISWFRIQEMFRLQSFHMFGVMGSAIAVGILSLWLIKKFNVKTLDGDPIVLTPKTFHKGQIYGGLIFGFGWAMTGACPGPLFAQIGAGSTVVIVTLASAIAGTWLYGALRDKLPH